LVFPDLEFVYTFVYLMVFEWNPGKSEVNLRERGVVFTDRTDQEDNLIRRIISARRSSRREREAYEQKKRG